MDALMEAIASIDAAPVDRTAKKRRITNKEPTAETESLIERLSADGLTEEGALKIRAGDVRCRPPTFSTFKMMLPQFRLKSVEAAARAEDVVILYAHVIHGEPLHKSRFRFNVDYLSDTDLRASLGALKSLKDLEKFLKMRYGTIRGTIRGERGQKSWKTTSASRRMLVDVGGVARQIDETELDRETIRDVINTMVTGIEVADARQTKIALQQVADAVPTTYDMACHRLDMMTSLPEPLASLVTLGDTLLETGQIVELLNGAASGNLLVSTVPMPTPPVGAMFVFNRNRTRYKIDGHVWSSDRHHVLNANGRVVNVCYAFTASGTQRRCYWWGVHVLVHYVTHRPHQRPKAVPQASRICRQLDLEPNLPESFASIVALGSGATLTVGKVVELLEGAASGHLPISTVAMQHPPVGSMFIFAVQAQYKLDGYTWSRGDRYTSDRTTRINAIYFKCTTSNVQRRCYVNDAGHVLVHYVLHDGQRRNVASISPPPGTTVPLPRALNATGLPPALAPVAAPQVYAEAFQKTIAAMLHTKALFQAPGTRMGTAVMRLAATTTDASMGRDVCAVAVYLSGTKATHEEKFFHFGEIKALVVEDRWVDALEYIETLARTL